jgi:hypothetical protein
MAIGDELQVLLGLVPIRDRAGIARGTMADAATAAANGQRPPPLQIPPGMGQKPASAGDAADITLPDDVRTEYTSGSGRAMSPVKAPSLGKGPVPGTPTADSERVVAASPAAAPSPEVVRGSDIIAQAYLQQQRQARLQSIFQSIGGIVGSLRGESVGGGGAAGGGGPDLNALKTIIDMRNQENQQATALQLRAQGIDTIQRKFGFSPEDAALYYDSGAYTKLIDQDSIAKREEAKRAGTTREELLKPEVVDALSRRLGQPPEVIRAGIRDGKITPKDLTDIEGTQSQTAERNLKSTITARDYVDRGWAQTHPEEAAAYWSKLLGRPVNAGEIGLNATNDEAWKKWTAQQSAGGQSEIDARAATAAEARAKTGEITQKTEQERKANVAYDFYKDNPEAFARLHGIPLEQAQRIVSERKNYDKYQETSGPTAYAGEAAYAEAKRGGYKGSREDWEAIKAPKPSPGEQAAAGIIGKIGTKYVDMADEVEKSNIEREGAGRELFKSWDAQLRTGSSLSEKENTVRKTLAKTFGLTDEAGNKTDVFFAQLNGAVQNLGQDLSGPLSDKDIIFLKGQVGNKEMSAEAIRRLMLIHDNVKMFQAEQKRELIIRAKRGDTEGMDKDTAEALRRVPTPSAPKVNVFIEEKLANDPQEVAGIVAHRNDPQYLAGVDHVWGRRASQHVLEKYDREHPNEGGR